MSRPFALAAFAVFVANGAAQQAAAPKPAPAAQQAQPQQEPPKPKPVLADVWTEARSRALFHACDADGDGRLDLFETADALELLADATDLASFRRLDRNRDGFVAHAEFDRHFQAVVQRGDALRVRPCRPVEPATAPAPANAPPPATPLQSLLQLHDADRSGDLDAAEIDALALRLALPKEWPTLLKGMDRDGSGRVTAAELQPLFDQLLGAPRAPAAAATAAPTPPRAIAMPEAWRKVDLDRDGKVNEKELAAALNQIDPSLGRWSKQLLGAADKDADGFLTPAELPPTPPTAAELQASLRKQ